MKPFTVILLYPDYCTDGNHDTYMTCVQAKTPAEAVTAAQRTCCDDNLGLGINDPDDLFVIAVIAGDHEDVKP